MGGLTGHRRMGGRGYPGECLIGTLSDLGMSRSPGCRLCSLMNRQSTNASTSPAYKRHYFARNYTRQFTRTFSSVSSHSYSRVCSTHARAARDALRESRPEAVPWGMTP
jgi:hypothetical protein